MWINDVHFSHARVNSLLWPLEHFYWKIFPISSPRSPAGRDSEQLLPQLASTDTSAVCTTPESLLQSAVALRWKTKEFLFKKDKKTRQLALSSRSFNSMLWEILTEVTEHPPHTPNAAQAVLNTGARLFPSQFHSDLHFILFQAAFLGHPINEFYSQLNPSWIHFLERSGSLPQLISKREAHRA